MAKAPTTAPKNPAVAADIQAMTFEQALAALDEIVRRLESGSVSLEESIAIYARGTQLKRFCELKLKAAESQVEKIVAGSDGQPAGLAPIDGD